MTVQKNCCLSARGGFEWGVFVAAWRKIAAPVVWFSDSCVEGKRARIKLAEHNVLSFTPLPRNCRDPSSPPLFQTFPKDLSVLETCWLISQPRWTFLWAGKWKCRKDLRQHIKSAYHCSSKVFLHDPLHPLYSIHQRNGTTDNDELFILIIKDRTVRRYWSFVLSN